MYQIWIGTGNRLVRAIMRGDVNTVKYLLQLGFSANIRDSLGHPALHLSVHVRNHEIAQLLLKARANPNLVDGLSESALLWAVAGNSHDLVRLLLSYGADPDQEVLDPEHGTSPRKLAKDRGYKLFDSEGI